MRSLAWARTSRAKLYTLYFTLYTLYFVQGSRGHRLNQCKGTARCPRTSTLYFVLYTLYFFTLARVQHAVLAEEVMVAHGADARALAAHLEAATVDEAQRRRLYKVQSTE